MKLSDAIIATLEESRLAFSGVIISEEGEGPRWKFDYDNWKLDPSPDILLLGAYEHPNTGNELVGGINLHYLDRRERDKLAKVLPSIMGGNNLYDRYWIGKRVAPKIFEKYYRTYNAKYIRGVQKDIMYPKYGMMKATKNWLQKKLGGIFKTKAQRQKEVEPKYPQDLDAMQDRLNQVVQQLQQRQPRRPTEPDTPEMRAARNAFLQFQRERTMKDIERREDEPLRQAQQDLQQEVGQEPVDPDMAKQLLQQRREQNRRELTDPKNDIDLGNEDDMRTLRGSDDDEDVVDQLEEQIAYYSPVVGHIIFEPFRPFVHENKPVFTESWGDRRTLSGEYWLNDGSSLYAENDYDHSMHVVSMARAHINDELGLDIDDEFIDWNELRTILTEQYPELRQEIWVDHVYPRPKLERFLTQFGMTIELWDIAGDIGDVDPRLYAAREWGWVRNEGNNLETCGVSRSKLKEIANGLYNAYEDVELERECFDIYDFNTTRYYRNVPFDIIETGDIAALRDYDERQRGVA